MQVGRSTPVGESGRSSGRAGACAAGHAEVFSQDGRVVTQQRGGTEGCKAVEGGPGAESPENRIKWDCAHR